MIRHLRSRTASAAAKVLTPLPFLPVEPHAILGGQGSSIQAASYGSLIAQRQVRRTVYQGDDDSFSREGLGKVAPRLGVHSRLFDKRHTKKTAGENAQSVTVRL